MVIRMEDMPEIKRRIEKYSVGGMTFDSYDVERDPTGEIGVALADIAYNAQLQINFERKSKQLDKSLNSRS